MGSLYRRYLLPGLVFTAAIVGGGYSTGRELVQFFLPAGPAGGLAGMAVAAAVFSVVLAASFELARLTRAYDYASFVAQLLGRGALLFDLAYVLLLVIVLAVLGAAAGKVAQAALGVPELAGTLALMAGTGLLLFLGSEVIEAALASVVVVLYLLFGAIVAWSYAAFPDRIAAALGAPATSAWLAGGVRYAGYNLAVVPAVLFCLRHQSTRREAVLAGLLAGPLCMAPGVLLYIALLGAWPQVEQQAVPMDFLLSQFGAPWFQRLFEGVFFVILVKTGTALLHALNERASAFCVARGRRLPRAARPAIALGAMVFSVFAASAIGLVDLIAKGYGALTWAFIGLLVVPVLTLGLWKIHLLAATPARIPQT